MPQFSPLFADVIAPIRNALDLLKGTQKGQPIFIRFSSRFRFWIGLAIAALIIIFSHSWVLAQTVSANSLGTEKSLSGMLSVSALINSLWLLLTFLLVMAMYGGFGLLTAGFCRAKNTVNILTSHLMVFIVSTFSFWAFGFALMFGNQRNALIGSAPWFLGSDNAIVYGFPPLPNGLPLRLIFLFHSALAGLTATIVVGAVAERVKFRDFLLFTIPLVGVAYALVGHWVWGGGWLDKIGFQDFAGSSVIHCVGGWAAFSGLAILGPRMGKYEKKRINRLPSHSLSLAFAGCFLLWLGWLGLVGGKSLALTASLPSLWLTVNFAAGASGLVAMVISWLTSRKSDPFLIINGVLAGLVAISASCNQISLGSALFVGAIAGLLTVSFIHWFDQVHLDDPVGGLSVHLVGGLWGTLAVGIFDNKAGLMRGQISLLLNQLIGIAAIGVFMILISGLFWLMIKAFGGLRVDLESEINGLDLSEHGRVAYEGFVLENMGIGGKTYQTFSESKTETKKTNQEQDSQSVETLEENSPALGEREIEMMEATLENSEDS